jgi:hypothetical protein
MLMQIKHYRFERMDETTVTFDLLINTDRIIRVNRAVATDSLPAGCEIEYADVDGRISYRIDLTLENFYADYLALNRTQGA